MSRMDVLQQSLTKKEARLDSIMSSHFEDVKSANGQPLNDKRNGSATRSRWDRQSDAIRKQKEEIKKTKQAIEREQFKVSSTQSEYEGMPEYITRLIDSGTLVQWRRHPRILFVAGVDKARILFNGEDGSISHRYVQDIPDRDQYAIFRDTFNALNAEYRKYTANQEATNHEQARRL